MLTTSPGCRGKTDCIISNYYYLFSIDQATAVSAIPRTYAPYFWTLEL